MIRISLFFFEGTIPLYQLSKFVHFTFELALPEYKNHILLFLGDLTFGSRSWDVGFLTPLFSDLLPSVELLKTIRGKELEELIKEILNFNLEA